MSDTLQTETAATPQPQPETAETETEAFTLEKVEKRYFGPDDLEDAETYISQVQSVASVEQIKTNCAKVLSGDETVPEGYGLSVIPIAKRQEGGKGNMTVGVAIATLPDAAYVATTDKGADYIKSVVQDSFMTKIANAVRPRDDAATEGTIPHSLEDFLTSMRSKESLKTFNELAPVFVKALRKKGMKSVTPVILRQVLQSADFASQTYGKVSQDEWQRILDVMIAKAKAEALDPAVLVSWKSTRDERKSVEVTDDLIDGALAEITGETETETEEAAEQPQA